MIAMDEKFYEEEERCGHLVTAEVKKLWAVELDLLDQIKRICEKHDLKYFACDGTLLGAVRHKGFIPWDDDIDLAMPVEDYEKFCEVAPKELEYPYFLQYYGTEEQAPVTHAKIRRSDTTGCSKFEKIYRSGTYNRGVFADIFPLHNVPDSKVKCFIHKAAMTLVRLGLAGEEISRKWKEKGSKPKLKQLPLIWYWKVLSLFTDGTKARAAYMRVCAWEKKKTKRVGLISWAYKERQIMDRSIFDSSVELPFENTMLACPVGYETFLCRTYGDWKTPVKNAAAHEMYVFDADVPYTEKLNGDQVDG